MKTKEIEVIIAKDLFEKNIGIAGKMILNRSESPDPNWLRARLIVDLPEKKIEITESQFDECLSDWTKSLKTGETPLFAFMKQKLFGKDAG